MIALKPELYKKNYIKIYYLEKYTRIIFYILILLFLSYPIYKKILSLNSVKSFLIVKDQLGMIDAKFKQIDENGNIIEIFADKAIHKGQSILIFDNITATNNYNNNQINLVADRAAYNKNNKELFFNNNVHISQQNDFKLVSRESIYNISKSLIKGNAKIEFENYVGRFLADSYELFTEKKLYYFNDNIIIFLNSDRKNAEISSNSIIVDDSNFVIIANDNPKYNDHELFLSGDELIIYYKRDINKQIIIDNILVNNNVRVKHKDSIVTGDKAVFYNGINEIEIIDNVNLKQENNLLKGARLKYNLLDSSIRVLDSDKSKLELKYEKK